DYYCSLYASDRTYIF
nr:immunoglobulin light chain junction region [Macaca mulatta]MOW71100.1 immunoglobulin light chain junction region [Macaca mulatta]